MNRDTRKLAVNLSDYMDRQPPFAPEAERAVLGAVLTDSARLDTIETILPPEAFYDDANATIYQTLIQCRERYSTFDAGTVAQALRDAGTLAKVGGVEYITQLGAEGYGTAQSQAEVVRTKWHLRRLASACVEIVHNVYAHRDAEGPEAMTLIDQAEQAVFGVRHSSMPRSESATLSQLGDSVMESVESKRDPGLDTNYHELDQKLGGMQPGQMIVIAARPSMGKTALALNIAEQVACGTSMDDPMQVYFNPQPVGFFSLEMTKAELAHRIMAGWGQTTAGDIRRGSLDATAKARIKQMQEIHRAAPLHIDDTGGMTLATLRAKARRMVAQKGVKLIVVDYLQLLHPDGPPRSLYEEVTAASKGIKAMAMELAIPVIVMSQLNRAVENRDNRRPRLSDLRDSGSIEQDANVVMFVHREEYYHQNDPEWMRDNAAMRGVAEVNVAKNRGGETGNVDMRFESFTTRFFSANKQ